MNNNYKQKFNSPNYFKFLVAGIILISVAAIFLAAFAFIMYLSSGAFKFSTVFATLSVAAGCFASSFFTSKKAGNKGWLTGVIIGVISFIVITLIALFVNSGSITVNTLFRFIILMLSSLIGGVLGVNSGNSHKYI